MSMLSESLTIGLLLMLVFGALFFYIYSRVTYVEKRIGLIENILIDIKMNQEHQPVQMLPPVPRDLSFYNASNIESETLPASDEETYSDVLDEAHESVAPAVETNNVVENSVVENSVVENSVVENSVVEENSSTPSVNYEAMTKEELTEVARKKGLRVGNRPGREKLLQLIQKSTEVNGSLETVPENDL